MVKKKEEEFIYCANRKCTNYECLRHDRYIPFNVIVLVEKFKLDKDGKCKNELKE